MLGEIVDNKQTISNTDKFKGNPRKITKKQFDLLKQHLEELGDLSGVIYYHNNKAFVGGNQRSEVFDGSNIEIIERYETPTANKTVAYGFIVYNGEKYAYREVMFTEEEFRKACIVANNDGGEFDWEILNSEWDIDELNDWGLEDIEVGGLALDENDVAQEADSKFNKREESKVSLSERFVFPPFSVLSARSGEWQSRKRDWLGLGLKSDASRETMKATGSFAGSVPHYYEFKNDCEAKLNRELTNKEFESNYLSDYTKDSTLSYTETGSMISIFDPVLCELMYKWFCIDKGLILDPFAGGSVRGIVANYLGYHYTGIDLRDEQIEANNIQADEIIPVSKPNWITGNSLNVKELTNNRSFDFIFSCPPYYDLEIYSDNPNDLSNIDTYEDFLKGYNTIIKQSVDLLNEDRFACFVVGDIRDKKGFYRNFVSDTITAFENAGAKLYNEAILVTSVGSLPIRVGGQFTSGRKLGKTHQNILIFFKGNPKTISSNFGNISLTDLFNDNDDTLIKSV